MLCNLLSKDQRSRNAKDPLLSTIASIKEGVINAEKVTVSLEDVWRVGYLSSLLRQFQDAWSICDEEIMDNKLGLS